MRIRQTVNIAADAAGVWSFLADPVLHAEWNPKLVSIGRERGGAVVHGERYEIIFRIGSREKQVPIEVTRVEPIRRLTFRHGDPQGGSDRTLDESYEVTPHAGGVTVVRTVDLRRVGVPWPFRLLFWVVLRLGWSEDAQLDRLKRIVEARVAAGG